MLPPPPGLIQHGSGHNAEDIHTFLTSPTDWTLLRQQLVHFGICQPTALRFPLRLFCRLAGWIVHLALLESRLHVLKQGPERCPK